MKKYCKELCEIGGKAFIFGAGISLGIDIATNMVKKAQFKRDLRDINKLLDKVEKRMKPKRRLFGKR